MIRTTLLVPFLLLALLASCGGGAADDLRGQMKTTMSGIVEAIEKIETVEDVEAAKPELERLAAKFKELEAKVKALPEEERKAVQADDEETKALATRMITAMTAKSSQPDVVMALDNIFKALQ